MQHAKRRTEARESSVRIVPRQRPLAPPGYEPSPRSARGAWVKQLTPEHRVYWLPGTSHAEQARKEAKALRAIARAAAKLETERKRAKHAASRAAHARVMAEVRAVRDARVARELEELSIVVTEPPPIVDLTEHAVLLEE